MPGTDKKFGTRDDKNVTLASAAYNRIAHTVTLITKQAFNKSQLKQLRVKTSFLTDTIRRAIDGNHDGEPGGDFVATLSKNKVTRLATPQARPAARNASAAVDRVLQEASVLFNSTRRSTGTGISSFEDFSGNDFDE
jgi:hypothetical protein